MDAFRRAGQSRRGLLGQVGVTGLAADEPRIPGQIRVVAGDLFESAGTVGKRRRGLVQDLGEHRVVQCRAVDHREVVRAWSPIPARAVQTPTARRRVLWHRPRTPWRSSAPPPSAGGRRACRPACSPHRCRTRSSAHRAVAGRCRPARAPGPQEHSTSVSASVARAAVSRAVGRTPPSPAGLRAGRRQRGGRPVAEDAAAHHIGDEPGRSGAGGRAAALRGSAPAGGTNSVDTPTATAAAPEPRTAPTYPPRLAGIDRGRGAERSPNWLQRARRAVRFTYPVATGRDFAGEPGKRREPRVNTRSWPERSPPSPSPWDWYCHRRAGLGHRQHQDVR